MCKTDAFECVECNASSDCNLEQMLVCKTDAFECVECNASSDCNDPAAAGCNTELNECEGCQSEADCIGIEGRPLCDDGTCVECTPATKEWTAVERVATRARSTCTETTMRSRETCETCVSDSECKEAGNRCVAMDVPGSALPGRADGVLFEDVLGGRPVRATVSRTAIETERAFRAAERQLLRHRSKQRHLSGGLRTAQRRRSAQRARMSECPDSGLCRDFAGGLAEDRCTYFVRAFHAQMPPDEPANPPAAHPGPAATTTAAADAPQTRSRASAPAARSRDPSPPAPPYTEWVCRVRVSQL